MSEKQMPDEKKRQKHGLFVRIFGLLLGLCLAVGVGAGVVSADENRNGLTNRLQNGSFEEAPEFGEKTYIQPDQKYVPAWNTTAIDGRIELFRKNKGTYITGVILEPSDGDYAAELNADEESTLYQIVDTYDSSVYEWGLDHGARNGTDIMALVIGPNQSVLPSKPNKNGRDQFMQMVDWLNSDANPDIKSAISSIEAGAKPKQYTVYSKKFAASGAFEDNAGNNAFSLTPSTIYTEEWKIWIMASSRATSGTNPWNAYGSNAEGSAGSSTGGGTTVDLSRYYLYTVPAGQTQTVFGFVSVGYKDSTTTADKAKTYGNFVDNINFTLYHPLSGSTTTHGSVVVSGSDGSSGGEGASEGYTITIDKKLATYVTDGKTLKIQAIVKKDDASAGCEFVGLYYTKQDENGKPVTELIPLAEEGKWIQSTNSDGDTVYTYYLENISSPADLHFVFIKNPTVTYDPNGGKPYVVERSYNKDEAENVYSFKPATTVEFIPPYTSKAAEGPNNGCPNDGDQNDGCWKFMGWLLTGDTVDDTIPSGVVQVNADKLGSLILPAVHTVACDYELGGNNSGVGAPQYFKIYNGDVTTSKAVQYNDGVVTGVVWEDGGTEKAYANLHKGLTMVAQWRWRQAFVPQKHTNEGYVASADGGTVEITSVTDPSDDENYDPAFKDNGGKDNGGKAYYAETNEQVTVTATAKDGYVFEGWYDKDGNQITTKQTYSYQVTANSVKTYYARFSDTVTQTYIRQVMYVNSRAWEKTTDDAVGTLGRYTYVDAVGSPVSSTAKAGEGYKFVGWYDSAGKEVTDTTMLSNGGATLSYTTTGDATYYARFKENPDRPTENVVSASPYYGTYDGAAHGIAVRVTPLPGDKIYYSLDQSTWSEEPLTRVNVRDAETIYVKVENPNYKTATASATITIIPRPVTITVTGKTDTKTYTGSEQTVDGFTCSGTPEGITVELRSGKTATARGTDASDTKYQMGLTEDCFEITGDTVGNYAVTWAVTDGWLQIDKAARTITATGYKATYDGKAHGITVNEVNKELGDTVYYSATGNENDWSTTEPTRTDVQEAEIIYVKVENPNYVTATASATITITPRPITITAGSASKVYDGEALTKNSFTVPTTEAPDEGLVLGQIVTAAVTGSQTKIGSSYNIASSAVIMAGNTDVTRNYDIRYVNGTLTVRAAEGITVRKTPAQTEVYAGSDVVWTITVENTGSHDAKGLTLTDALEGIAITAPDGVDPASFSVPARGEVVFTVTYQNASAGTYVNHVEISQPKQDNTTEKIAEDDAEAVVVRDRHTTSPETPVAPGKPVLNTEDHVAYIIGYPDGTVRPGNHITRAEVASIFFRLLTDESRTEFWSRSNDYSDVSAEKWYNNPISTLSNADIISGYPDGTFRPNAPITRAEFATIAARFSEVVYNGGNSFTDVPENHWAARFISMAEHLGWITGYPDGSFRPNQAITRAESMTLINRVLERAVEEEHMLSDMLKWVDNTSGAWYYEAVQEATNSHTYARTDKQVPGLDFCYEDWHKILEAPDWAALERNWIAANSR
ncbi:S-layer homology domain-containing protein [Butyricicoccus pullicaecorum]|nr:S-layer homology domain-containing protein [Butyricicoccus pullicaecorum]